MIPASREPPASNNERSPSGAELQLDDPGTYLERLIKYALRVYPMLPALARLRDGRRRPSIPTADVVYALFFGALLRVRSLNALEGRLMRPGFQRLLGRRSSPDKKTFSADTVARVLDSLETNALRALLARVVLGAERKKLFRSGPEGAKRVVALDGWEMFSSESRHCRECLDRELTRNGTKVIQYYHRVVVALLTHDQGDLVLDFEPFRCADLRKSAGVETESHEGEQTAALRLIERLHKTYGNWIDLFTLDALYPNGTVLTQIDKLGYGAVITVKKETDEPFKDAIALTAGKPPDRCWDDPTRKEYARAWDVDEVETLDSFRGKLRVVQVKVKKKGSEHNWSAVVVGARARKLPAPVVHGIHRSRWKIENTAFNQWTQLWNATHVFRHTPNAIQAILLLLVLAFNLTELFVHRRLRQPRSPKDPCYTLLAIAGRLVDEIAALLRPVRWASLLLDTS